MNEKYAEKTLGDQCLLYLHSRPAPLQTVGHPCFACMPLLLLQLLPTVEGAQTTSWL